jgi:type II secretory pathway pseudopilin PulG
VFPCFRDPFLAESSGEVTESGDKSPHSKPRGGFTILELLLASLFGAILVAALWSLLSTYERMFTVGEERTERAQLVRSVLDQLAEDLTSAIADNAASPSAGPAPVRRFGLFGSSQFFQVDVLQAPPVEVTTGSDEEEGPRRGRARGPRVPELHTVQWRFSDPEKAATGSRTGLQARPSWSGLARRELDWETPASDRSTGGGSRGISRLRRKFRFSRSEASPGTQANDRFNIDPDDPAVLHVPEVAGVAFRYFDGQGFSDEWNSLSRKSLPMAVEIVLRVGTDDAPRKDAGSRATEEVPRPADRPEEVAGETHRLLVYLPTTSLARRSEAEKPSPAAPAPTIVDRPRPLPGPPPPSGMRPSVQTIQPDHWMRTGQ